MASSSKTQRIVALIIGLGFFALIAAFIAMAMISRDEVRLNAIGPLGPAVGVELGGVRFSGTIHVWEVLGSIGRDQARTARLDLNLRGPTSESPGAGLQLSARLVRPDAATPPGAIDVALQRTGPGRYVGLVPLQEGGAWQLRLAIPEVTGVLNFTLDP